VSEISDLGRDLQAEAAAMVADVVRVFDSEGREFARQWSRTARLTAGKHGKHYPKSITHELTAVGLVVQLDVGPERGRLQGSMGRGFEFGSVNQRPHLDGARHLRAVERRIERAADAAIERHIP